MFVGEVDYMALNGGMVWLFPKVWLAWIFFTL